MYWQNLFFENMVLSGGNFTKKNSEFNSEPRTIEKTTLILLAANVFHQIIFAAVYVITLPYINKLFQKEFGDDYIFILCIYSTLCVLVVINFYHGLLINQIKIIDKYLEKLR